MKSFTKEQVLEEGKNSIEFLKREELEKIQVNRLKKTIERANNSPFPVTQTP